MTSMHRWETYGRPALLSCTLRCLLRLALSLDPTRSGDRETTPGSSLDLSGTSGQVIPKVGQIRLTRFRNPYVQHDVRVAVVEGTDTRGWHGEHLEFLNSPDLQSRVESRLDPRLFLVARMVSHPFLQLQATDQCLSWSLVS